MKLEDYIKSIGDRTDNFMEELTDSIADKTFDMLSKEMQKPKSGNPFSRQTLSMKPINKWGRHSTKNEVPATLTDNLYNKTYYSLQKNKHRNYRMIYWSDCEYLKDLKPRPYLEYLVDKSTFKEINDIKNKIKNLTEKHFIV